MWNQTSCPSHTSMTVGRIINFERLSSRIIHPQVADFWHGSQVAPVALAEPASLHTPWPSPFCVGQHSAGQPSSALVPTPQSLLQPVPVPPSSIVLCSLWVLSVGKREEILLTKKKIRNFQDKFKIACLQQCEQLLIAFYGSVNHETTGKAKSQHGVT